MPKGDNVQNNNLSGVSKLLIAEKLSEGWLTSRMAAEVLGVSYTLIARLLKDGHIAGARFGHYWFTRTEALSRFLARKNPELDPFLVVERYGLPARSVCSVCFQVVSLEHDVCEHCEVIE